jgi:hypothetical protein
LQIRTDERLVDLLPHTVLVPRRVPAQVLRAWRTGKVELVSGGILQTFLHRALSNTCGPSLTPPLAQTIRDRLSNRAAVNWKGVIANARTCVRDGQTVLWGRCGGVGCSAVRWGRARFATQHSDPDGARLLVEFPSMAPLVGRLRVAPMGPGWGSFQAAPR